MYTLSYTVYKRNTRCIISKFIRRDIFIRADMNDYKVFMRESTLMRGFYD